MYINFANLTIPLTDKKDCTTALRSWRTLHSRIKELDATEPSLTFLARLLSYELTNPEGPRAHILARLHMRFNRMRQQLEFSKVISRATR